MLATFLRSHPWVAVIPVALVAVFLLLFLSRRRKRKKQSEELAQLKRRDEALADALRNPQAEKKAMSEGPMEITWDDQAIKAGSGEVSPMVELVELATYSRRKYVYRLDGPIRIGSGKSNQLELLRDGVEREHCELFLRGQKVCLRSMPGARTVLKRGKTSALVSTDGVYLKNGDHIQIGSTEISFRQFRA